MQEFPLAVKQYSCVREAILDSEVLVILNDFFSSPRTLALPVVTIAIEYLRVEFLLNLATTLDGLKRREEKQDQTRPPSQPALSFWTHV